mmetsp:Transcript_20978/g.52036  ORF Transcript_20978/g.52036 Transcript_20978/m.52036 type:complete len:355 (+) Transcript_20978:150-1214(+)|eukprot:CAMPEP_0116101400 /NCGR_PEP_ID=MMETSP0327-20121206/12792_1 /TAXON_ID=44447 /ORGANISM="Pseudo-nitzschia delicatissima, Strain B596" /LENGTH=354 /DNA_ID=CAMNT_0003593363 /DNA_START=122 /DNA_END=1186 /DNA_ORIENTATION=-
MDTLEETGNSIPFSSLNSPSSTGNCSTTEQEELNTDPDGLFVERNSLTRNADGVGLYGGGLSDTIVQRQSGSRRYILRALIAVFLSACILYVIVDFMGERRIEKALVWFLEWTHEHPYRGIIAVILCYIIATVFFVPGSILTFGAGFAIGSAVENLYLGILLAVIAVFIGASIGSICSFLLGRYLFRDCVIQMAFSYPLFQAIERALETNGLKIMVLLRLSPLIPFNALDYISGITSISLKDYALALLAILPGAIVLCIAGATASSLSDKSTTENSTIKIISIVVGLVSGGYGVYLAGHYSKMELDRILAAQAQVDSTSNDTGTWHTQGDGIVGNANDDDDGDIERSDGTELVL